MRELAVVVNDIDSSPTSPFQKAGTFTYWLCDLW